jgi:predicted DNA-binding transcriptional regulator YafY
MKAKKRKGEQVINVDQDRQQIKLDLLPCLYENIIHHNVLSITYQPYDEEALELVFHPHKLKEYNGRWFLFGHAEDREPENGFNLALDRIVGTPIIIKEKKIIPPPTGFYANFFKDIVGVSHIEGNTLKTIHIRAHNHSIYKLMETKKIHSTQAIVKPFGKYEHGEYGEFVVHVEINNEFIGCILHYGAGLEIVKPDEIREIFKERVRKLYSVYEKKQEKET